MDSGAGIVCQIVAFCFLGVYILAATNFRTPTERFENSDALVGISAFLLLFWGLSKILIYGRARELAHLAIFPVAFFSACRVLFLDTLINKSMITSTCTGLGDFHVFGLPRNEQLLNKVVKVFGIIVTALELYFFHKKNSTTSAPFAPESSSSPKDAAPEPAAKRKVTANRPDSPKPTAKTPVTANEPELPKSATETTVSEPDSPEPSTGAPTTANGSDTSPTTDKTARSATYIKVKNPSMTGSRSTMMCESVQTPCEPNKTSAALSSSSNSMLPSPIMEIQLDDALIRPVMGSHSAQVSRRAALREPKRSALRTQRVAAQKHKEAMAAREEARLRREAQQKTTAAQVKTEAHDVCELEGLLQRLSLDPTPEQYRREEAERKEAARKQRKAQAAARKLREAEEKAQRKAAEAQRRCDAKEQAARQEQARKVRQAEEEAARREAARVLKARLRHEIEEKQEALKKRQAEAEAYRRREIEEQAAREVEDRKQHEREVQERISKEQEAAEQAVRDEEFRKQLEHDERLTRELEAALQDTSSQRDESEGVDEMDSQATGAALGVADAPETQMGDVEDDEPPAQPLQNEKLAQEDDVEMPDGQMPQQAGEPLVPAPILQQEPAPPQPTSNAPTLFTHPVAPAAAGQQRPRAIPMPFSSRPQFLGQSLAAILSSTTATAKSGWWNTPNMRKGTPRPVPTSDDEYRPVRDRLVAPGSKHLKRNGEAHGESTADLAARKRPASETIVTESAYQTEAQILTRAEFGAHGAVVTWVPQSNSDLAFKTAAISRVLEEMYQEVYEWRYSLPHRSQRPTPAELQAYSEIDTEMRSKMIDRTRDIETMLSFYANQDNVKLFASPEAPPAIFDNACRKLKPLVHKGQLKDKLLKQPTIPSADTSLELKRKKAEEDIKLVCQRMDELDQAIASFRQSVEGVNKDNSSLQNLQPAYDKITWNIREKTGDWMMRKGVVYQACIAKGAEWAKFGGGNATLV